MTEDHKNGFQHIICACSSGILLIECVVTNSWPPAAWGSSIRSQMGQFELRVLLVAQTLNGGGGGAVCGFAPKGPYIFLLPFVKTSGGLWRFSCCNPKASKNQVNRSTKQENRSTRHCWYVELGSCEHEMWPIARFGSGTSGTHGKLRKSVTHGKLRKSVGSSTDAKRNHLMC